MTTQTSSDTSARMLTTADDRALMSRASAHSRRARSCNVPATPSSRATTSAARAGTSDANPRSSPLDLTHRRCVSRSLGGSSSTAGSTTHKACSQSAADTAATKTRPRPPFVARRRARRPARLEHAAADVYRRLPHPAVGHEAQRVHREAQVVAVTPHHLDREARPGLPPPEAVQSGGALLVRCRQRALLHPPHRPQAPAVVSRIRRADERLLLPTLTWTTRLMAQWLQLVPRVSKSPGANSEARRWLERRASTFPARCHRHPTFTHTPFPANDPATRTAIGRGT